MEETDAEHERHRRETGYEMYLSLNMHNIILTNVKERNKICAFKPAGCSIVLCHDGLSVYVSGRRTSKRVASHFREAVGNLEP